MESSQLRRISIICISLLCLSPVDFFSNKLFDSREITNNIVIAKADMKLEPNYLLNNYEIFNPNIKTASENLEKLASENKKKEISDSEIQIIHSIPSIGFKSTVIRKRNPLEIYSSQTVMLIFVKDTLYICTEDEFNRGA